MTSNHTLVNGDQIFRELRDILMDQAAQTDLIPIPPGLIDRAETRLQYLKDTYTSDTSPGYLLEADALIFTLDTLQELRSDRIWYHAYYRLSSTCPNCTEAEQRILDALVPLAVELRGVNP